MGHLSLYSKTNFFFLACLFLLGIPNLSWSEVQLSTATGQKIEYDAKTGWAEIKGEAVVTHSSGTLKADKLSINMDEKMGYGEGNVVVETSSGTLTGSNATYYWEASTGVINNASGESSPWRFTGRRLDQISTDLYLLETLGITTCDHNPPHFVLRSNRGRYRYQKRINMKNARFMIGDAPSFWSPYYTKSLRPSKVKFRIEPGQTSRDGFTNETTIGYPLTDNTYATVKWDWLQKTGNGVGLKYDYNLPDVRGVVDTFRIRDHNSDPKPQSRRWSILWNHYQKVTNRLTFNSKFDMKSDSTFGNEFSEGNDVSVENQTRGLLSEAGFTYQFDKATIRTDIKRQDKFDSSISSEAFISQLIMPNISFNTTKLNYGFLPFYTQFNGSWNNQTRVRNNPDNNLRYIQSANTGVGIDKDIRIRRAKMTLTPQIGTSVSWESDQSTSSTKDFYSTRYNYGLNWRQRIGRYVDFNSRYNQSVRFRENQTRVDTGADDRGIESEKLSTSITSRWARANRITLSSGYDLRKAPRSDLDKFVHQSARFDPPTLDTQVQLNPNVNIFFRETYAIFDTSNDIPVNTPLNTSGEIQFGHISKMTFFSQGFNYTKSASGSLATLNLTNKLKFFLTPKWHINLFLSYRAIGENKLNYQKIKPTEKSISVVRDLHCWIFRMEFSERLNRTEASFFIDLKASMTKHKDLFKGRGGNEYYPYRDFEPDVSEIFPYNEKELAHDD